jgi:hypothetical protein
VKTKLHSAVRVLLSTLFVVLAVTVYIFVFSRGAVL